MKKYIFGILAVLLVVGAFLQPSSALADDSKLGQFAPVNPELESFLQELHSQHLLLGGSTSANNYGYMPPIMDLSHLNRIPVQPTKDALRLPSGLGLPSTFDWRTQGKVTSIKNQNTCATCWLFGTLASLESRISIVDNVQWDFSEQNLVCCTDPSWVYLIGNRCNGTGNSMTAADTLIKKGTRLESCNPYDTSTINAESCNDACTTIHKVTGFRLVANSASMTAEIKNAIYNYGPVTAAYFHSDSYMYIGYKYYYPNCTTSPNHMICIVGWDDTIAHPAGGGSGVWIVKNSWGTSWGNSGYFYLCYGSANLQGVTAFYGSNGGFKAYNPSEKLYYWDEAGPVYYYGWYTIDDVGQMASLFTASPAGTLTDVDFWTTSNNAQYTIYVYNGSFGSLLTSQSGTCAEAGYYSIPLANPVSLSNGQQFTVAVSMRTPGYNYPLAVEARYPSSDTAIVDPPIQTGKCFARHYDSDSWYDASGQGGNVCLRARVNSGSTGDEVGVWRGATRYFYLDVNGNGIYNGTATERFGPFLSTSDTSDRPIAGDWDNDGRDEVGVWRGATRYFYLDVNGNGIYNGTATERFGPFLSTSDSTDVPVAGDWNGL